ncbi:uncharacterized protein HMPREF1541_03846 [Cyphellophora europaea CBS 101466]|uniref:Protein FYV10 n=1 Tax=Cyphellophora europaea (strain CBS 101466) TaxID=1220924 RepID=W2RZR4_CYPE1|nr:uncharacterized protein HMPREF1541_03846 [Cyphellophora europaea CBS 101466]ETN41907.1 hypothetical protein HMPREF1541_03846 [Cyphellophora europaea CBS 101466]
MTQMLTGNLRDVNNLIMDYLINEGYPSAAEKFAMEANIEQPPDDSNIQLRVQIRDAIHRGDLQQAIELIGEASPELLDQDANLHFSLLRLQLVELIRSSFNASSSKTDSTAVAKAIQFAQQNLAPYATLSPSFKNDLERAMALLIVPRESWTQSQQTPTASTAQNDFGALSELVDPSLRKKVAKDVNEAILASQGQRREANIRHLVRTRAWAEQLAREKRVDLPDRLSLGLDGNEAGSSNGHNGQDTEMGGNAAENSSSQSRSRPTSGITDALMTSYAQLPS